MTRLVDHAGRPAALLLLMACGCVRGAPLVADAETRLGEATFSVLEADTHCPGGWVLVAWDRGPTEGMRCAEISLLTRSGEVVAVRKKRVGPHPGVIRVPLEDCAGTPTRLVVEQVYFDWSRACY